MKKGLAVAATLIGICLVGTAEAQTRQPQSSSYTYVFGEFDHYTASGSLDGGGLGAGWKFNRYFSLQGGVQYARKYGADFTNGYAEAVAYLPLSNRLSLFGSLGGSYAEVSASASSGPTTITV